MKKLMLCAAVITMSLTAVQAQEASRQASQDRVELLNDKMIKGLGLTDDQAAKVKDINARYKGQFEAMREENAKGTKERSAERKELGKQLMTEYKAVLTPEQYTKVEAKFKEKRAERSTRTKGASKQPQAQ